MEEDYKEGEDVVIDGQMCYDELEFPPEEPQEIPNIILDGQLDFDAIKSQQENFLDISKNPVKKEVLDIESQTIKKHLKQEQTNNILEINTQTNQLKENKIGMKELTGQRQFNTGIITKSIDEVLHESMIPYTEHVVLDRALPRVEDGLKPGQRRILYSMLELGVTPDKPYRKSARIVGDCMGKYHPHGDSSVYDAMVRMAQNFSLCEPLIDGHGNFGSVDGDSAAAMRYTEARLTPLAMELLRDLDKNTVRWSYNFDDTLKEPDMLPGRFPNLLVNGTSGIAVGVATNIPPHNLGEVIDGVVALIDNPKITLEKMMKIIPAPDFPTGGIIVTGSELYDAYNTGKGKIILKAKTHIEEEGEKKNIVITELPYQVNKASLLQKIVELKDIHKDKLSYIQDIRDESDRNGMRAIIKIKKEGNAKAILDFLYKNTNMQISVAFNMVAIADGKPKQLGLLDILSYYVEYQRIVIQRRTKFELDEAKDRAHIIEGLLVAIKNIDEVVRIIKKSQSVAEAKTRLKERFNLSEKQAQAILDMRLARLVNLEIYKLEQELKELKEKIEKLTQIYNSKQKQLGVVRSEILDIKKKYAGKRKSKISTKKDNEEEIIETPMEEAFARDVMVGLTANGGLKKIPLKNYQLSQKVISENSTLNEVHTTLFAGKTNEKILVFTNLGNVLKIDIDKIPETKFKDNAIMLTKLDKNIIEDEIAVSILKIEENKNLIFWTKNGMVKSTNISEYLISKSFYQGIKLKDNDKLVTVCYDEEDTSCFMVAKSGMALRFNKDDIPVQGRTSVGVKGINIDEDDQIIYAGIVNRIGAVTIVTNKGFAKKVPIGTYDIMPRYRKGLKIVTFKDNGNELVFANYSKESHSVVVSDGNKLKLLDNKKISYDDRTAKGKPAISKKLISGYIYIE